MYCPRCGEDNYEQVRHCRKCGIDLGPVHLAVNGRLPDLTTLMTEEKRRRLAHRGLISLLTGGGFLLISFAVLFASLRLFGQWPSIILLGFLGMLIVPLVAYGLGSLLSARFIFNSASVDYTQRFNVVRDMLDAHSQADQLAPPTIPGATDSRVSNLISSTPAATERDAE